MEATERKEWLTARRNGLGATDLTSIAGVGWQTARDVYLDKIGETPLESPVAPLLRMGLALEPLNAELYRERFPGVRLVSPGLMWSKSVPWAFATFDRLACDTDTEMDRAVEMKYTNYFGDTWGDDGTDQVPDGYAVQTTWQNHVLVSDGRDVQCPHLSALDSRGNHRVYEIPFNAQLAGLLLELGEVFWKRVKTREEVGPDWVHPLQERVHQTLATIQEDTSFRIEDAAALDVIAEFDRLSTVIKDGEAADEQRKQIKQQIRAILGEHACGILPDGRKCRQWNVKEGIVKPAPFMREAYTQIRIYPATKKAKVPR